MPANILAHRHFQQPPPRRKGNGMLGFDFILGRHAKAHGLSPKEIIMMLARCRCRRLFPGQCILAESGSAAAVS